MPCFSAPGFSCSCHYFLYENANVYSCSNTSASVESLPPTVPQGTDWFVLTDSQLKILSGTFYYLNSIVYLNLSTNHIESITEDFIDTVNKNQNLRWLNLANNYLASIPSKMQELTFLQGIWLSGNLFDCHCSMTWMVGWLNNFTTRTGDHVIIDYKDILCYSGLNIGDPIYKLDEVSMGCFPKELTIWQKVGIGIGTGVAGLIIIILSVLIIKRSRDIKFILYYYCKWGSYFGVPKDDKDENLNNIKYDAFLYYR